MIVHYYYHCICTYPDDAPEPEGFVGFGRPPEAGMRFLLPSSGFKETWEVTSVDLEQGQFYAKKVEEG